jgi:hypothetical protein
MDKKPPICCVYALFFKNRPTKKYYGSTINLNIRFRKHQYDLTKNSHGNSLLQEDFNKQEYGAICCEIIKEVPKDRLKIEEDLAVSSSESCYNKNFPNKSPDRYIRVKTVQTRIYVDDLKRLKDEVARRRHATHFRVPLDTPASVMREALNYVLGNTKDGLTPPMFQGWPVEQNGKDLVHND